VSRFKIQIISREMKTGKMGEPEIEIEPRGGILRLAKQPEPDGEKPIARAGRGGVDGNIGE
jgi:hypothetical protein